jgi:hypothetical protein
VREVSSADQAPRHALRQAGKLARPALRLAIVQFLALYAALLGFLAVSGGRLDITEDLSLGDELMVLAGVIPLAALGDAFLYLAWQRIALEGDDRVLVAVSQSVRIARKHYGTLLVLVLAESLLQLPVVLSRDHAAMIAAVFRGRLAAATPRDVRRERGVRRRTAARRTGGLRPARAALTAQSSRTSISALCSHDSTW